MSTKNSTKAAVSTKTIAKLSCHNHATKVCKFKKITIGYGFYQGGSLSTLRSRVQILSPQHLIKNDRIQINKTNGFLGLFSNSEFIQIYLKIFICIEVVAFLDRINAEEKVQEIRELRIVKKKTNPIHNDLPENTTFLLLDQPSEEANTTGTLISKIDEVAINAKTANWKAIIIVK